MMGSRFVMALRGKPALMAASTFFHSASRGPAESEKFMAKRQSPNTTNKRFIVISMLSGPD